MHYIIENLLDKIVSKFKVKSYNTEMPNAAEFDKKRIIKPLLFVNCATAYDVNLFIQLNTP